MSFIKTLWFWNKAENVAYFRDKSADFRVKNRLEKLLATKRDDSVPLNALDLGCGGGRHSELLVNLGFKTSVFDLNIEMLRCTQNRVGKSALQSVKRGSIVKLPYKTASFDVVVTTGVLHQAKNFQDYQLAVSELSRILKPGGVVCLNIFTSLNLDETYIKLPDAFSYRTKEGLDMSLLSKETFYELMKWYDLELEEELSEDIVNENTGKRSVLRCNFVKLKK